MNTCGYGFCLQKVDILHTNRFRCLTVSWVPVSCKGQHISRPVVQVSRIPTERIKISNAHWFLYASHTRIFSCKIGGPQKSTTAIKKREPGTARMIFVSPTSDSLLPPEEVFNLCTSLSASSCETHLYPEMMCASLSSGFMLLSNSTSGIIKRAWSEKPFMSWQAWHQKQVLPAEIQFLLYSCLVYSLLLSVLQFSF